MNLPRLLLRVALGRRLPVVSGEVRVRGLAEPVTVRRDQWGVPHIEAETDADGWFGLGFCHGQDRAFQLEMLLRVARGTLAELVGPQGLPADRMSRRIGFRRAAVRQWHYQHDDVKAILSAYVAGVNAGMTAGLPRRPHEFALLGAEPTPWEPADVLAFLALQSFLIPSNWDVELARLRILLADGPDALRSLDPSSDCSAPSTPHSAPAAALDRLAEDLALFQRFAPAGGGSNNWAIAGSRTASGKPLLANDPHLAPSVPPLWYLAHVSTPDWSVAGATMAGTPAFAVAHNGFACWGVTAALTDNTDLYLETLPADGSETLREAIRVKGRPEVIEEVLVTPRGPVISPLFEGVTAAVSLRAVWLEPRPVRGFLDAPRARDFDSFRRAFADWPTLPLNVVYADAAWTIGWQLVGQLPVRRGHNGLLPAPANAPGVGWAADPLPFDRMPFAVNPPEGFVATANNDPAPSPRTAAEGGPYLGADFCEPYRVTVIREELARQQSGWNVFDCLRLQLNVRSKPWEEMRAAVLELDPADGDARQALELLRNWDGHVAADSAAAAVYELFVAELCVRVARAKAPKAWPDALGGAGQGPLGFNLFGDRRVGHLARLLREPPAGWFPRPWADEMADALAAAIRVLRARHGPGPGWWHWGDVRPLAIDHLILGRHRLLAPVFNLPRVPHGGDMNTVGQAAARPMNPTAPAHMVANLRAVFDTADWTNCRFALAGGQSGNPFSDHYADLFEVWRQGDGVPIPFAPEAVFRAARRTLRLTPG
jgi:penicillin amidase